MFCLVILTKLKLNRAAGQLHKVHAVKRTVASLVVGPSLKLGQPETKCQLPMFRLELFCLRQLEALFYLALMDVFSDLGTGGVPIFTSGHLRY